MFTRIVTYIKNEQLLLTDWLEYHLTLVPGWCIHVIDNESDDDTPSILEKYKKNKGINIHTHNSYVNKGSAVSDIILRYKKQPGITIPIDGDEFITLYRNGSVIFNPDTIKEYISTLPADTGLFMTLGCLNCIPEKEHYDDPIGEIDKFVWVWKNKEMCKKFYANDTFISTDHGNHNGKTNSPRRMQTDIALLHYHDTGRSAYKQRCELDIKNLGIDMEIINTQLIEGQQKRAPNTFPGHEKVNSYLNIKNWSYNPTGKFDYQLKSGSGIREFV